MNIIEQNNQNDNPEVINKLMQIDELFSYLSPESQKKARFLLACIEREFRHYLDTESVKISGSYYEN